MGRVKLDIIDTDRNYQILRINIDNDAIALVKDLSSLTLPGNVNFKKGIIIFGKASVWLYAYLTHLCHPASFVGIYDPRKGAIIIETHSENAPNLGTIIDIDDMLLELNTLSSSETKTGKIQASDCSKVIAFIGPPHSGKTVLIYKLQEEIRRKKSIKYFRNDFFIVRACPDGEGNWCLETMRDTVKTIRYKGQFNDEFIDTVKDNIESLKKIKKLIFVDCGGKIDIYNQKILNNCNSAIIVSNSSEGLIEWNGAAKASNLKILAKIRSYKRSISLIENESPLKIKLGYLKRENEQNLIIPEKLIDTILS